MLIKRQQNNYRRLLAPCIMALLFIRLLADGLCYLLRLPPVDFGTSYDFMLFSGLLLLSGQRFFTERLNDKHARAITKFGFMALFIATVAVTFYVRRHPGLDPRYLRVPIDALYLAGLGFFLLDGKQQVTRPPQ